MVCYTLSNYGFEFGKNLFIYGFDYEKKVELKNETWHVIHLIVRYVIQ